MPRPPGLTNAQWKADVDRRAAVTTDRRNRLNMKKARDATAEQEEARVGEPAEHCVAGQLLASTVGVRALAWVC